MREDLEISTYFVLGRIFIKRTVLHKPPLKIKQQIFASENYADSGDKNSFLRKVDVKGK